MNCPLLNFLIYIYKTGSIWQQPFATLAFVAAITYDCAFFFPVAFQSSGQRQKEPFFMTFCTATYSLTEPLFVISRLLLSAKLLVVFSPSALNIICLCLQEKGRRRRKKACFVHARKVLNWSYEICSLAENLFLAAGDLISFLAFCQVEQAVKSEKCTPGTNEQLNRWHESEQEFRWTFLELAKPGDPWLYLFSLPFPCLPLPLYLASRFIQSSLRLRRSQTQ